MSNNFDVIIIGGGINGAGIARDCALRGLKTLILDKGDFASGTSSKSTKLVHGGIRYLENFEFKLVWEALHERKTLTQIAPDLVKPIQFVIPVYKGDKRPLWLTRIGMFLYDLMAGFKNIHRHKNLNAQQILKIMPGLKAEGLKGGGIYYDCQTNDSRLTLANIKDAVAHGAVAKNYTEVANIRANENLAPQKNPTKNIGQLETGVEVICQDTITAEKFTYTTNFIVNATGPWLDQNLQKWHLDNTKNLRLTKGIHFFVPRLTTPDKNGRDHALLINAKKDNRVFFIIPHGEFSLVGTTDTDYKADPDKVAADNDDIQYLLDELNRLFPGKDLTRKDVVAYYAGLRPLLNNEGVKEGKITREYRLKEYQLKGATILTVIGGKLTTYRSLAQKVTDRICEKLDEQTHKCQTSKLPLPVSSMDRACQDSKSNQIIPESTVTWDDLTYAIKHEFVRTAEDFISRRTELYLYLKKHPSLVHQIQTFMDKNSG